MPESRAWFRQRAIGWYKSERKDKEFFVSSPGWGLVESCFLLKAAGDAEFTEEMAHA